MSLERTFGIVKPDAVAAGAIGGVIDLIEKSHLKIVGLRYLKMSPEQAAGLLRRPQGAPVLRRPREVHDLGPVRRHGPRGRERRREVPRGHGRRPTRRRPPPGTIRAKYGTDIEKNAVHGSDSPDNAKIELGFFFTGAELG